MIFPSSIVIILSAFLAISKSWVIIIIVWLYFLFEVLSSDTISSLAFESKLPVGSSARTKDGSVIRALPIEVLCCCPPDNSFGKCFLLFSSPKVTNNSCNFFSSTFLLS